MGPITESAFWTRIGMQDEEVRACVSVVERQYSGEHVTAFEEQGYCSFTFLITADNDSLKERDKKIAEADGVRTGNETKSLLVQLRPPQHQLDLAISSAASELYPDLTAETRLLDIKLPGNLSGYEIKRLPGVPLARALPYHRVLSGGELQRMTCLIISFAEVVGRSWNATAVSASLSRFTRADSPMASEKDIISRCTGRVGSSIYQRLQRLAVELPDAHLRRKAAMVLRSLRSMEDFPIVLTHGDLIPTNILVCASSWRINGLIDWAEAEYLPFGTCLYGLEGFLGYSDLESAHHFVYYDAAPQLRALFWSRLIETVPEKMRCKKDLQVARDLGVLLWYGIAWDDGALNRVVNEVNDAGTLACLRIFLAEAS